MLVPFFSRRFSNLIFLFLLFLFLQPFSHFTIKLGPESKNVSPDVISRLIGKIVQLVMDAANNIDDDQKRGNVQKKAQDLMSSGLLF